jgi:4-amino-4-deoxy-L-arabinose transferase-like glycosyltransferase
VSFFSEHKHFVLLSIIFIVGFALRLGLAQDPYLHNWDEKFHALVAKNMIDQPLKPTLYKDPLLPYDLKKWYDNHIWLHKQPLPLWMISFCYKICGAGIFITRIPSLIFSLLAIIITYILGNLFFDKKVALLSAFFVSVNGLIIELGAGRIATDHYDLLFFAFIEIAVLFAFLNAKQGKFTFAILSGLFIGCAMLTKWLPCLIVLPVHFFLLLHYKTDFKKIATQLLLSLITCLLIGLPWQFFISKNYPAEASWEYRYNWLHFTNPLEGQGDSFLYYFEQIRINYSEIIYLPLIYFLYLQIKTKFRNHLYNALSIWIFVPLIFFTCAQTKMQGYILFICPALFFITANFFFTVLNIVKVQKKNVMKIVIGLLLLSMIILPLRYCFERTRFGFSDPKFDSYHTDYQNMRWQIPEKAVVLNVAHPIEFMFYNSCIAYSNTELNAEELKKINSKGYKVLSYDPVQKTLNLRK